MNQFNKIMQQAQAMQEKMQKMQESMKDMSIEGTSGGGIVKVVLDGKGALKSVAIDPSLLEGGEKEILEDLIVAAYNNGKEKVEEAVSQEMSKITGGLALPPGMSMPF